MLEFRNVSVSYRESAAVLSDFTLTIAEKEIVALVGESGSGKTTAIRAAMGLLPEGGRITSGSILFEDEDLSKRSNAEWCELRGTVLSMIFQDAGAMLNPIRTIGSQFVEYIRIHQPMSKKDAWQRGCQMLEQMNLPHGSTIMKSYPFQLSGGMRQRVGIAMAMVFQPKLLLADEPTSALDVTTQAQIVKEMLSLRERYNTSILVVTHNLGLAAYMADRIFVMKDGSVVDSGNREKILNQPGDPYTRQLLDSVPDMRGKRYV